MSAREQLIQNAIEEWAAIAGGPRSDRVGEPTLARYIEAVLIEGEKLIRGDALNVLTVYDDHTPAADRGPWRDRLMAWATVGDVVTA